MKKSILLDFMLKQNHSQNMAQNMIVRLSQILSQINVNFSNKLFTYIFMLMEICNKKIYFYDINFKKC